MHPPLTVARGGRVLKKQLAAAEPSTRVVTSLFGQREKSRGGPRKRQLFFLFRSKA